MRPHLIERSFRSIHAAAAGVDYEVVVVADYDPEALAGVEPEFLEHCHWVVRERNGIVDALNLAMLAASGDYVFSYNDESTLHPRALRHLHEQAVRTPYTLLTPKHVPHYVFQYYGLPFAPFPFATRELIAMLGGIADPAFKVFYADPDLSLRAHAARIPVRVVEHAIIHHHQNVADPAFQQNYSKFRKQDCQTFRQKWDHLGAFRDP